MIVTTVMSAPSKLAWLYNGKDYKLEYNYVLDITEPYENVLMIYGKGIDTQRYTYGLDVLSLDTWKKSANTCSQDSINGITSKKTDRGYYLQDELGSPVRIVGEAGNTKGIYSYDAFGRLIIPVNLISQCKTRGNIYSYTGYQYDLSTGLMYAQARYYLPEVGRFISEDAYKGTVAEPQSLNWYVYCRNNPLKFVDPSGYKAILTIFAHNNHAWIAYTPEGGDTQTIGTWGNGGANGIVINCEITAINSGAYKGRVSYTVTLSDEQQKAFLSFVNDKENNTWALFNNCSSFTVKVWAAAGQDKLNNKNTLFIPTPAALARSIKKKKGYQINAPVGIGVSSENKVNSSSNSFSSSYDSSEVISLPGASSSGSSACSNERSASSAF